MEMTAQPSVELSRGSRRPGSEVLSPERTQWRMPCVASSSPPGWFPPVHP